MSLIFNEKIFNLLVNKKINYIFILKFNKLIRCNVIIFFLSIVMIFQREFIFKI